MSAANACRFFLIRIISPFERKRLSRFFLTLGSAAFFALAAAARFAVSARPNRNRFVLNLLAWKIGFSNSAD